MNLFDVGLLLLIVLGAVSGFRYGFVARVSSWLGLIVGLLLSLWTVPAVLDLVHVGGPGVRFMLAVMVLALTVAVISTLFQKIGLGMRRVVHATPLRIVDRLAGFAAGVVVVIVLVWLMIPAAAFVPGQLAAQVRGSTIVGVVKHVSPPSPNTLEALSRLVDLQRFPDVFDDLRPAPDTGPPPSAIPVDQKIVTHVTASTVRVDADGCRRGYVGSGWVADDELVVTNAHVVAGSSTQTVRRTDGTILDAQVVRYDPVSDLAVLEVGGLDRPPLPLGNVEPDSEGAAIGYPGGQEEPRVAPAGIRSQRTTVGRDIYGDSGAEREVVYLASTLRKGDSGGPVIDPNGAVVGVIFAVSPDRDTTAYALAPDEVWDVLDGPETSDTGRCL